MGRRQNEDVPLKCSAIQSPFGLLCLAVSERGLVASAIGAEPGAFQHELALAGHAPTVVTGGLPEIEAEFLAYFAGDRSALRVDLDLARLTPFQRLVLEEVARIPLGEVRSYRDIAEMIGKPLAARAVGSAVAANPIAIAIPCHRVIKSDGSLGYYAFSWEPGRGVERKRALLRHEGVELPATVDR